MAEKFDVSYWIHLSSRVNTSAMRIYNMIREVGYGKLTADNALHQLIEEYHNLKEIGSNISLLVRTLQIQQEEGEK